MGRRTLVEQAAAVRRAVIDGEPREIVAQDCGVTVSTFEDWMSCWSLRRGRWRGRPLEPIELELGLRLSEDWSVVLPRTNASNADLDEFMMFLGRPPGVSMESITAAYQRLEPNLRDALGPAFDVYLEARDLASAMRAKSRFAMELASHALGVGAS